MWKLVFDADKIKEGSKEGCDFFLFNSAFFEKSFLKREDARKYQNKLKKEFKDFEIRARIERVKENKKGGGFKLWKKNKKAV